MNLEYKKPTVIHIITRLVHGGADENTIISCVGLANRGWNIILVVGSEYIASNIETLKQQGVKVLVLQNLVREISLRHDFKAMLDFRNLCHQYQPVIVHTHTAKAGIVGRLGAKLAGVPYVVNSVHGSPVDSIDHALKKRILTAFEKITSRCNDYYISVGREIFDKYCQQIKIMPQNYKIVRSAFNTSKFANAALFRSTARSELGLTDKDIAIGMVARVAKQKGYEYFVEVCHCLAKAPYNFKFFSIGRLDDPDYFSKIKNSIANLENKFTFIGPINHSEMPAMLSSMDIIIHTALWEGLPRAVAESLVANKPVVTFNVDGVNEIIQHGQNGYIVQSGDVGEVCKNVLKLIDTGLKEFSLQAVQVNEKLREEFNVENMIDGIEQTYQNVIGKSCCNY